MELKDFLREKRAAVLTQWFDAIVDTYPGNTSDFLKKEKDRFSNPVGHSISQGIDGLLSELLGQMDMQKVSQVLDDIVRIRAIQDFTAAQAVSFIFLLKKVIRNMLLSEKRNDMLFSDELPALESQIDIIALSSFDIYMKCREKLYEIKSNEVKNMTFRLLQKANLICEVRDQELNNK